MREALTLVSHKAAEKRHWNEAEEDDEEDCPTDDTLRLRAAKKVYRNTVMASSRGEQQLTALSRRTHISFLVILFRSIPYNLAEMK